MRSLAGELLKADGWPADSEVDLWLCSDDEIRELNRSYRNLDAPTDVLSFPQYEPGERPAEGLPAALGDVVISVDTAVRQALARGVSLEAELLWLFLHSVLHLIGYDDDTDEGLELMLAKARAIVTSA